MTRLALLIPVALLMLCLVHADHAAGGWKLDRATEMAAIVWHHPCNDHVTVSWSPLAPGVVAQAQPAICAVTYSSETPTTWATFCTYTLHEYGHLAGYRDPSNTADPMHAANPRSVMHWASLTVVHHRPGRVFETEWIDPRCRDHGRAFLARVGAA